MEDPGSWNLLISSLAACELARVDDAWSFLAREGLVRDAAGDRDRFASIVRQVLESGPIAGPSEAARVASGLRTAGIALPAGDAPDPFGNIAQARRTSAPKHGGA